jgi:hypothetical protein
MATPEPFDPKLAARLVDEYLHLSMVPDPEGAARYVSPDVVIYFTGGREMRHPLECTDFNAARYKWVKKAVERTDVVAGGTTADTVVYSRGTLYGEWLDGTPFEGNRYVDRFVLVDGKITRMDVWNDSAEWLLVRAGLAKP